MMTTNFDHACGVVICGPNYLLIIEPLVFVVVAVLSAVLLANIRSRLRANHEAKE